MSNETFRVRFITKHDEYKINVGDIVMPSALNRKGLSDAINSVLENENRVPFDFKINDIFLRTSLAQAVREQKLSPEQVIKIEYFPAFKPPVLADELKTDDWVSCIKYFNGKMFYSLYDGSIHYVTQTDNKLMIPLNDVFNEISPVKSFSLLGDDTIIAGSLDGSISVLTMDGTTPPLRRELHNSAINAVVTFPGLTDLFMTAGSDSVLALWSTNFETITPLEEHSDSVTDVHWIENDRCLSCGLDKNIYVWDLQAFRYTSHFTSPVANLSISSYGPLFLTTHPDRTIRLWDTRENERRSVVREFKSHQNWVSKVVWINENVFVSGSYDGSSKSWNIGTDIPLSTLSQKDEKILTVAYDEQKRVSIGGSGNEIHHYEFS